MKKANTGVAARLAVRDTKVREREEPRQHVRPRKVSNLQQSSNRNLPKAIMARNNQLKEELSPQFQLGKLNGQEVYEATIDELQHHLSNRNFTSVEYVGFCLDRVRKVGGSTQHQQDKRQCLARRLARQ